MNGGDHPTEGYGFFYHGTPSFQVNDRVLLLLDESKEESNVFEVLHMFMGAFYDVDGYALRNIEHSKYPGMERDFESFKRFMADSSVKRQGILI